MSAKILAKSSLGLEDSLVDCGASWWGTFVHVTSVFISINS